MKYLHALTRRLPARSTPLAIANIAAFAIQGLFALLLLGLFEPSQVATFLVISQIAFFWHNLAMAQSNTTLLANAYKDLRRATRSVTTKSIARLLLLLPLASLALFLSGLQSSEQRLIHLVAWTIAIALLQMCWYIVQAYTLRCGTGRQSAIIRVLPPLTAATLAIAGKLQGWPIPVLLFSTAVGFGTGAIWLLDVWRKNSVAGHHAPHSRKQHDDRSSTLKIAYTFVDGLFFTGLSVYWQKNYGSDHAAWLLTLMRLLGFIPALVHTSWQQVILAAPEQKNIRSIWIALASSLIVLLVGVSIYLLSQSSLLPSHWQGLQLYVLPVVLWQTGACFSITYTHMVFSKRKANLFSTLVIAAQAVGLLILIAPTLFTEPLPAPQHFLALSITYTVLMIGVILVIIKAPPRSWENR